MRLDSYLFQNHFTQSRNRAKELIVQGLVTIDGKLITKSSFEIDTQTPPNIEISTPYDYVSRAGEKLRRFLNSYPIDFQDRLCLDIGSSTGGFVEVLLEEGAKRIDAVDVGRDQLHSKLRADSRVHSYESCDIRDFQTKQSLQGYDVVTCDVSFVGISHLLETIDRLAKSDIVILFKPQFEVGKAVKRTKKGVVKDKEAIMRAQKRFESEAIAGGWRLCHHALSQLKGKEGNVEIFYHFQKG